MLKKTREQKKLLAAFVTALLLGILASCNPNGNIWFSRNISSLIFAGTILAWALLVNKRLINVHMRRLLLIASIFMILLFVIRICRWDYFEGISTVDEYARYAFHICFTTVPLCAFLAALCVGKTQNAPLPRWHLFLWGVEGILTAAVLTNPLHGLMFRNLDIQAGTYEYGPVYFACVAWEGILGLAAFGLILGRCRVFASREKWYLPALAMMFGVGLLVFYYICNGAPRLFGLRLYNVQEAFCLTFILPFEELIQTGILPSNSRYELFFRQGSIGAVIQDNEGEVVYASRSVQPGDTPGMGEKESREGVSDTIRVQENPIRGGKIVWREDLTAIREAEEKLRQVTEQLEDENELIRQENEIRAERIGYETQNRLYDRIAGAVRGQAQEILESLKGRPKEPELSERLPRVAVLGAYVKRMGNLMLVSDERGSISSLELTAAIRESFEGMKLWDKVGSMRVKGEEELPSELAIGAYDMVETILETALSEAVSFLVQLDVSKEMFLMKVETDAQKEPLPSGFMAGGLRRVGAEITMTPKEEGWLVTLQCPLPGGENGGERP